MILWHNKDPIYSLDFSSNSNRLCTTGSDNDIKIWSYVKDDQGSLKFTYLSSLSKHSKPVNVARFSPGGNLLASGSDDGTVVIWRLNPTMVPPVKDSSIKEVWSIVSILRVTTDAYDLSWSSNGLYLSTGSTDNTVQIWSPINSVCWDPLGNYLLTESSDGSCRLYSQAVNAGDKKKKKKTSSKISAKLTVTLSNVLSRRAFPVSDVVPDLTTEIKSEGNESLRDHKMFYDERVFTFFRRPDWSPDGSLFIAPTGKFKATPSCHYQSTSYIFSREMLSKPIVHLPSNKPTIVVKFNPLLYTLDADKLATTPAIIDLAYRMVFAICTQDTIVLYDTQSTRPLLMVSELHYAPITDMSWSSDGSILMVTSEDGFCSYLSFAPGELGTPVIESEYPESMKLSMALRAEALKEEEDTNDTTANATTTPTTSQDGQQPEKRQKTEDTPSAVAAVVDPLAPAQPKPKRRIQPNLIK
eukprot:gene8654-10154_t